MVTTTMNTILRASLPFLKLKITLKAIPLRRFRFVNTHYFFSCIFNTEKNNCATKFQVSQNGLDVVSLLIERLGNGFRPYLNTTLPPALDRLGDTRETVREKAHYLITKLMEEEVIEPQPLFEKMQSAFTHKNGKVREEILILMQNTLNV